MAKKAFVLLVSDTGHIKRLPLAEFPVQGRGGQGVQTWKPSKAAGKPVGMALASSEAGDADVFSPRGRRLRVALKDIPAATRAGKPVGLREVTGSAELFDPEPVAGVAAS
jgi:DNA gyrase subunit A